MSQIKFLTVGIFLIIQLVSLTRSSEDDYTVTTNGGKVKGEVDKSKWTEKSFVAFKGIPYAKPPVGELRFQPPEKHEGWTGVRENKYSPICPQLSPMHEAIGNEDCLYLNVFAPTSALESATKRDEKLPVLVFIHGGGFQFESGQDYGPNYWMEEKIVYVTFNYRLGILGFLQTSDGTVSGNMGLKDQVLVLKWVQENIEYFGGDSNQVTLMGVSSGGASVHLHMLSELSKGLFHRAISQSGTALNPWAIVKGDKTARIAKNTNCQKNSTEEYVACLKDLKFQEIVQSQAKFAEWYIDPLVPVGPAVEKKSPGAFISQSPYKLIRDGKFKSVPWILGVNSEEGLLHAGDILKHHMLNHVLQWEWPAAAPITLILRGSSFDVDSVTKSVKQFYFKDVRIGREVYTDLISMYSDRYFFHGTHHAAKLHSSQASSSSVYLYLFNYQGRATEIYAVPTIIPKDESAADVETDAKNETTADDQDATVEVEVEAEDEMSEAETEKEEKHEDPPEILDKIGTGVSHYDQLLYLFNTPYFPEITESEHIEMAHKMRKAFTHFIKTGSAKNWTKVTKKAASGEEPLKYNVLGTSEVVAEPWTERVAFWDSLSLMELDREMDAILDTLNIPSEKDEL